VSEVDKTGSSTSKASLLNFIIHYCVSHRRDISHSIIPFSMSEKHAPPTGTSSSGIPWFNFSGYDDHGLISAAILIPPTRRIVYTSGQVGTDSKGTQPESLEDNLDLCEQQNQLLWFAQSRSFELKCWSLEAFYIERTESYHSPDPRTITPICTSRKKQKSTCIGAGVSKGGRSKLPSRRHIQTLPRKILGRFEKCRDFSLDVLVGLGTW